MEFVKTYLDLMVFGTLGLMSFITIWLALERLFYYRQFNIDDYEHSDELNIALTDNLTTIYTIGANAPYVGLLGTVIGILITFYELGHGGEGVDPASIMLGLALALKATAAGLFVAIPAIISYNTLLRKVDIKTAMWNKKQAQKANA